MKLKNTLLALLFLASALPARAGELDILLDRLVEKNVIDPGEAQEIRIETQEEVKKEISQQRNTTLPMWIQAMKLRGDVRLRYQFNDNKNKTFNQHRGRYRLRFFVDAKVNEKVYMGFGFASGSNADPRSTNQTFGDNNGKKNLYIDYVFAEYNANDYLAFTAGRTKNPLWMTNDMLWDTDINMEGLSARLNLPLNYNWQLFTNAGFMVLGESATDPQDPYMLFAQPGLSWRDSDGVFDFKAGAAFYSFSHVRHSAVLNYRPSTGDGYQQANTLKGGKYKYKYDTLTPELEVNMNILDPISAPVMGLFGYEITYLGIFGNTVQSLDHGKNNTGWLAGVKLGQRKVEDAGQWQLRWSLRRLEKDAWLDNYPDSDFYGGSVGVKGSEVLVTLGLMRDFALDLDYYRAAPISGSLKSERIFQADINLKF
ncbi:MAG: putative porin [Elusimicrobiota bacterium]|nr:putative porin [Elusimicrobiota bacterium]